MLKQYYGGTQKLAQGCFHSKIKTINIACQNGFDLNTTNSFNQLKYLSYWMAVHFFSLNLSF